MFFPVCKGERLVADPGDGAHDPPPLPLPLTTPVHRVSLVSTHIHLLVLVCNIDKTQVENAVRIVNTE